MPFPIAHKKILAMVLLGSILEAYDYSLYGYFAPLLALQFFPSLDLISSLLMTFTIFAVGFITRPLGAAILGSYGDKYGRKKTLMLSILLMAIPTALIGMLPTYEQIGIAAGLLLALCRLLQGFAVGAEFVGTMVYMIEYAPANKRTLYGSLSICSGYFAMLFTAFFIMLLTHLVSSDALQSWGWRIPFLMGILLGLIGLYIRAKLPETPSFKTLQTEGTVVFNPLFQTIFKMPLILLQGIGIVMLHAFGFYLLFVYLRSYLDTYYAVSTSIISFTTSITLILAIIVIPFIGMLAERMNKKNLIVMSCTGLIILAYPLFHLLDKATFLSILVVQIMLTLLLCLTSAVLPSILADIFPSSLRYTGMALTYNLSVVIFGGTSPLVLTLLVEKTQNNAAPSIYLIIAAFVTLVSTLLIRNDETKLEDVVEADRLREVGT